MITALFLMPAYEAVTVTDVCRDPDLVETAKLADVEPAGTTILAGTVTDVLFELVNATLTPPAGAGAESVIVALGDAPPITVDGAMAKPTSVAGGGDGGVTVNVVVLATPA